MIQALIDDTTARPTPEGFYSLGFLLEQAGNMPQAREAYAHALNLDPDFREAKDALSALGTAGNKLSGS